MILTWLVWLEFLVRVHVVDLTVRPRALADRDDRVGLLAEPVVRLVVDPGRLATVGAVLPPLDPAILAVAGEEVHSPVPRVAGLAGPREVEGLDGTVEAKRSDWSLLPFTTDYDPVPQLPIIVLATEDAEVETQLRVLFLGLLLRDVLDLDVVLVLRHGGKVLHLCEVR